MQPAAPVRQSLEFVPADYFRRCRLEELAFGRGPLEIDLGCGDGEFLVEMAAQHPDRRFLGIERLRGRVRKVCRAAGRVQLENLRVLRLECAYAIEYLLPHPCAAALHLLFPDPWPKKRHQSRRLVNPQFVSGVTGVLERGGELFLKTDDEAYFHEACAVFGEAALLEKAPWPREGRYPETGFERLWLREGRTVHRAVFRKL
ncbi:MAG TPA: tRNA (guanosine(46)-N7)-methyltransferase TrmB [Verrucomicrobiales bacterium]|nr:tRNA (guanosine(46)-N7)-methyltransferase TrmB [Verrucomicrobiales bacterium]